MIPASLLNAVGKVAAQVGNVEPICLNSLSSSHATLIVTSQSGMLLNTNTTSAELDIGGKKTEDLPPSYFIVE